MIMLTLVLNTHLNCCIPYFVRRFEVLPTIMDPQAEHSTADSAAGDLRSTLPYTIKSLSRSASQPIVFPRKHPDRRLNKLNTAGGGQHTSSGCGTGSGGGAGGSSGGEGGHEDDLDIIKQIIEKDETLHDTADQVRQGGGGGIHFRSQSLSHIPGEFSSVSSLPTLHHGESMHLLHSNYFSAPDFSQLSSPPGYNGLKHGGAGAGDMGAGDSPYHQLTHESRSSSLSDCHAAVPTPLGGGGGGGTLTNQNQPIGGGGGGTQQQQQHQNNFVANSDRRGSIFDSQQNSMSAVGYSSNTQVAAGPLSLPHHSEGFGSPIVTTYDFTRHRDSSHSSLSFSESDGSQTPVAGYGSASRHESNLSDSISSAGGASMSFQYPSLSSGSRTNPLSSFASTPNTSQDTNIGIRGGESSSSSSLPLRDYLASTAGGMCKAVAVGAVPGAGAKGWCMMGLLVGLSIV